MAAERSTSLKRELGSLESYALLIGILIGAGIFQVTSEASAATGPSVLLGHLVLAPIVLASSVAYLVFLSTPLGLEPGGEVLHIARIFGSARLAFVCGWLKVISYLGAGAYLADALAINLIELFRPGSEPVEPWRTLIALSALGFFFAVHSAGVRALGRLQVWMCAVLGLAIAVLVVPGLFAVRIENYRPFFTGGAAGFAAALPPLFFSYAGFESLAQTAGEVEDSRRRLPRVFVRGILATTVVFVLMTVVAFGVLPSSELGRTHVPMSAAAATYLPIGARTIVTLGAVFAVATSLNATMLVPARLAWYLARAGQLPAAFESVHAKRGTPSFGLAASFAIAVLLLVSQQLGLALRIAVVSLVLMYALHSAALLALPRRAPELCAQVEARVPRWLQVAAAWVSIVSMLALALVQFRADAQRMAATSFAERAARLDLTSLELLLVWMVAGFALYHVAARKVAPRRTLS